MNTRVIPSDELAASLAESETAADLDKSSVKLRHMADLQVLHRAGDLLFDHLTDHIAQQDNTIRELRKQLAASEREVERLHGFKTRSDLAIAAMTAAGVNDEGHVLTRVESLIEELKNAKEDLAAVHVFHQHTIEDLRDELRTAQHALQLSQDALAEPHIGPPARRWWWPF